MLRKLMKYDLKWLFKNVLIYYILGIGFAVLGRLGNILPDSIFFNTLTAIFKGASISLVISGLINGVIRIWVRVVINMYKDESYLTHTLPIDIKYHFISKILSALILIVISIIVILITVLIAYYGPTMREFIINSFNLLEEAYNINVGILIVLITILLLLEVIFIVFSGVFGIVYGQTYNYKKLKYTFIYGLSSYFSIGIISLIIMMILSLFNSSIYNMMFNGNNNLDFNTMIMVLAVTSIIYFISCAVLYFLTSNRLKKGINIE